MAGCNAPGRDSARTAITIPIAASQDGARVWFIRSLALVGLRYCECVLLPYYLLSSTRKCDRDTGVAQISLRRLALSLPQILLRYHGAKDFPDPAGTRGFAVGVVRQSPS